LIQISILITVGTLIRIRMSIQFSILIPVVH
jgi:hypothetical protein